MQDNAEPYQSVAEYFTAIGPNLFFASLSCLTATILYVHQVCLIGAFAGIVDDHCLLDLNCYLISYSLLGFQNKTKNCTEFATLSIGHRALSFHDTTCV